MKINELMIGDWAQQVGSAPIKVGLRDLIGIECGDLQLEPIPLTDEVLSKHFVYSRLYEGYICRSHNNDIAILSVGNRGLHEVEDSALPRMEFSCMSIEKLQHFLRTFGRDDLADNFKL